jgi:hypothetical protein
MKFFLKVTESREIKLFFHYYLKELVKDKEAFKFSKYRLYDSPHLKVHWGIGKKFKSL